MIKKFCVDVGSRKSFDEDVQTQALVLTFPNGALI